MFKFPLFCLKGIIQMLFLVCLQVPKVAFVSNTTTHSVATKKINSPAQLGRISVCCQLAPLVVACGFQCGRDSRHETSNRNVCVCVLTRIVTAAKLVVVCIKLLDSISLAVSKQSQLLTRFYTEQRKRSGVKGLHL